MKLLKNPEAKKAYTILSIAFFIFTLLCYFTSNLILDLVKREIINYKIEMVAQIVQKNPDVEKQAIELTINENSKRDGELLEKGKEILNKYGYKENMKIKYEPTVNAIDNKVKIINEIIIISLFIFIFIFVYFIFKFFYKEISNMKDYTEKVIENDFTYNIDSHGEGEISILKNTLFKMTNILKEHINKEKKQKLFLTKIISDISHQLKTPMTSLIVFNDLMSNKNMDWQIRENFLQNSNCQLKRMDWLVKSLLKLSKLDAGVINFKKEKVKAKELIESTLSSLKAIIEENKEMINIKGDEEGYFIGDMEWSREALINIIKNSIEHSKERGILTIEYEDNPLFLQIKIKDNGEGIRKEELPHIFKRFYKSTTSIKSESVGIGLALSKTIIENQNGNIYVESELGVGTEFTISFFKE